MVARVLITIAMDLARLVLPDFGTGNTSLCIYADMTGVLNTNRCGLSLCGVLAIGYGRTHFPRNVSRLDRESVMQLVM